MATLIIQTNNSKELNLIKELLKQMRINSKEIDLEEEEDFKLGQMMLNERTGKSVSKSSIINKLKNK